MKQSSKRRRGRNERAKDKEARNLEYKINKAVEFAISVYREEAPSLEVMRSNARDAYSRSLAPDQDIPQYILDWDEEEALAGRI